MAGWIEYECPCCGGMIEFDSSTQKMKCPYCDTEFDVDAMKAYEAEKTAEHTDKMDWESRTGNEWTEAEKKDMQIYICQSCGGEILCDQTTTATQCPYCNNNIVLQGKLEGDLRPDYVIPFKLDKKAAKEGLKRHLEGKKLLPRVFKDENHIDEVKGVYVPFWLFDAKVDASARYRATKIRVWSDHKYRYTATSFYSVVRGGEMEFSKIPVDGSSKMPDDLMESLEPFDFSDAVDFQTAYLAGYFADRYDVKAEESVGRANERIKATAEQALEETVHGYATVIPEGNQVRFSQGKVQYALYPVWLLHTEWKGKQYTFAMNGQTGKFVGNLPVDWGLYWKYMALIGGVTGILSFILSYVMWLL